MLENKALHFLSEFHDCIEDPFLLAGPAFYFTLKNGRRKYHLKVVADLVKIASTVASF